MTRQTDSHSHSQLTSRFPVTLALALAVLLGLLPGFDRCLGAAPDTAGEVRRGGFRSRILDRNVAFRVLPPPGYDAPNATNRFPVLYWLPDAVAAADAAPVPALDPRLVHDAIRQHILPPLLVVYLSEGASTFYTDGPSGLAPWASVVLDELIPAVDRDFRTIADREHRALQGIGRGGFGAVRFALDRPEMFGSAVAYSGDFPTASDLATREELRATFQEAFGSNFERAATNHPSFLALREADRVRGRTGLRLVVGDPDPRRAGNLALRDALNSTRLAPNWSECRKPIPLDEPLPAETALDGLEFTASWIGLARSPSRDGPWVNPPARLPPRLRHHVVHSEFLGRSVGYSIYLPDPPPAQRANPLPVVFHLHGAGETESSHIETTGYLDVALKLQEVEPFAWVWLCGGRHGWFMDSADGRVPAQSVLLEEVIPRIEARWNLGGSPWRRAVDGWGMGGFGAARFAALRPAVFGAALLHNPILPDLATLPARHPDAWVSVYNTNSRFFTETEPFRLLTRHAEDLRPIARFRIVTGGRSPALADSRRLRDHLESLNLAVEFEEVPGVPGFGPELYRQTGLLDVRFLGKAVHRPEP
ncbi:MAG: alpha/beta hydrolase-fold protein [Limisphaerales bacterium]